MDNKKLLVVFTSYYFGDKADKVLTELEVPHQLMATPPELNDMCGLSIQIEPSIVDQVQTILKEHKISPDCFGMKKANWPYYMKLSG